jgi:WD40 repeat protein
MFSKSQRKMRKYFFKQSRMPFNHMNFRVTVPDPKVAICSIDNIGRIYDVQTLQQVSSLRGQSIYKEHALFAILTMFCAITTTGHEGMLTGIHFASEDNDVCYTTALDKTVRSVKCWFI